LTSGCFFSNLMETMEDAMSRIDVVPTGKDTFKVLVNFIQRGVEFSSIPLANSQAEILHSTLPQTELHLCKV